MAGKVTSAESKTQDGKASKQDKPSYRGSVIAFPGKGLATHAHSLKLNEFPQEVEDDFQRVFLKHTQGKNGLLNIKHIDKVCEEAEVELRESERCRVNAMIPRVLLGDDLKAGISLDRLWALLEGCITIEMLNALFNDKTMRDDGVLEPRCTYTETLRMFDRFFFEIDMPEEEFKILFDEGGGGDDDGQLTWEELLTLFQKLMGPQLRIAKTFSGDAVGANRGGVAALKQKLKSINTDIVGLDAQIIQKQTEIAEMLEQSSTVDSRAQMHSAWDNRDKAEQKLLGVQVEQFKEMQQLLVDNDQEKDQLIERFKEALGKRDAVRGEESNRASEFGSLCIDSFAEYPDLMAELERISKFSNQINDSMKKGTDIYAKAETNWQNLAKHEKPPQPSTSADAITFLNDQRGMVSEIGTKLKMMQQERDKYEDMIEKEVTTNKAKRIECININMKITSHEAKLLSLEAKKKDYQIQNATLKHMLKAKKEDTASKKVKELRNTLFQFGCEKEEVEKAVDESKSKLRMTKKRIIESRATVSRLNIELGELKIILEGIKNYEADAMGEDRMSD